ncbi:MAG: DNA-directed RNA polymerase subunit K [Nitrosotalea sp.]
MTGKGKIMIGPPTLTRFEKARILGARALQLSLGAPPFIPIPKDVATSLDLAYAELEKRVIPITIRRVLPNGDFQNIPIDLFD